MGVSGKKGHCPSKDSTEEFKAVFSFPKFPTDIMGSRFEDEHEEPVMEPTQEQEPEQNSEEEQEQELAQQRDHEKGKGIASSRAA